MRSSDKRYFQAQRTKREPNQHLYVPEVLSMVRKDRALEPMIYAAIRESASEFTHVMLACGRTATDFRRNFRRGVAEHNRIPINELAPMEALVEARLDGFTALRLNREQYRNVRLRAGKTKVQDAVIHDPQGQWWSLLMHYWLAGPKVDHLEYLNDLRSWGVRLLNPDDEKHLAYVEDKVEERYFRRLVGNGTQRREIAPEERRAELLKLWTSLREALELYLEARRVSLVRPRARLMVEKLLVILEAYAAGGDMVAATIDPDTSQRRCSDSRMLERIAHVALKLVQDGIVDPATVGLEELATAD